MQETVSFRKPVSTPKPQGSGELTGENEDDPLEHSPLSNSRLDLYPPPHASGGRSLPDPMEADPRRMSSPADPAEFRRRFYRSVTNRQWNDWRWQVQHRIRQQHRIEAMLTLSEAERGGFRLGRAILPFAITPYYMSLLNPDDPSDPLRRTVVPTIDEFIRMPGEAEDPLGEETQSPLPGLVHRYPDRVLLLAHDFCSTYCRYCTRSRMVGHGAVTPERARLQAMVDYIHGSPQVRDVLISGGDPLTLGDERLEWLLARLRRVPHLEIIRIGTKVPAVLPQRITPALTRMLRRFHPLWMSVHFTHPRECTPEAYRACERLADAGIPLGSQTVLLKGINDDVATMRTLMHHMLRMRVRPYYLYQCDPITGSSHFRTPVACGQAIIRGLRGFTSGYAVPTYVIDAPGGGGKIPLMPDYVRERRDNDIVLCNFENKLFHYPDATTC